MTTSSQCCCPTQPVICCLRGCSATWGLEPWAVSICHPPRLIKPRVTGGLQWEGGRGDTGVTPHSSHSLGPLGESHPLSPPVSRNPHLLGTDIFRVTDLCSSFLADIALLASTPLLPLYSGADISVYYAQLCPPLPGTLLGTKDMASIFWRKGV